MATLQRSAVVAGTVAGAAAVVLVAKIIIRQHRFKVSCGCLLTCTCKEKMKRSAMGVASVAAEPTSGTSAPTSKEAPAEACCSAAPEPSAADAVRVEAVARKPPHSPDTGTQQPDFLTRTLTLTLTLTLLQTLALTLTLTRRRQAAAGLRARRAHR